MPDRQRLIPVLYAAGLALGVLAYLLVWIPNDAVALRLTGVEVGEWIKFLPQVRSGQAPVSRNLFYLPPITLGSAMMLVTAGWPNRRQTWLLRGVALLVSLLAFPQLEVIRDEPSPEWRLRLGLVAAVALLAGAAALARRRPGWVAWLIVVVAVVGGVVPGYAYQVTRPVIAAALDAPVGIGPGVWLNGAAHAVIALAALLDVTARRRAVR